MDVVKETKKIKRDVKEEEWAEFEFYCEFEDDFDESDLE